MPLTNQPYLPLYVKDWLTNNKLKVCSAGSHGLLINIMCVMHKEENYGTVLLKQKFKQSSSEVKNFALMFAKLLPFDLLEIEKYLNELMEDDVLKIDNDLLKCERMIKDAELSEKRAISGSIGGKKTQQKDIKFAKANTKAKSEANSEYEYVNENEIVNENKDEDKTVNKNKKGEKSKSLHSQLKEIYFDWHRKEIELEPLYDGSDAPALNVIIDNLKKNIKTVGQGESIDKIVVDSWKFILNNYKNWDKKGRDYCQKQTRVRQIRTNLTNILINLKHEKGHYTADGKEINKEFFRELFKESN